MRRKNRRLIGSNRICRKLWSDQTSYQSENDLIILNDNAGDNAGDRPAYSRVSQQLT